MLPFQALPLGAPRLLAALLKSFVVRHSLGQLGFSETDQLLQRLHLLTKLLCSVKMEAAVAILSGVLPSLPLLPRVLISSSSLLMLSALHGEPA
ncbi:hypothetical protein EYF80_014078 [Liparis tanakae]|uniref:Uncharacterized protein n=1 Tax=Liparis tanakae TaxID=230148 RepID=A0A4Z2IDT2_9TELE|nr:hypothetical protein EYF80_014078 [Liparis tanakae]